ncbi:MAG: hypothetical protein GY722_18500 [bacterium]|nr:hypothetical protein [bacterium]
MSADLTRPRVRRACHHDCPDICAWEVTVVGSRATALRGIEDHPVTRGQPCPNVNRFIDRVYHPERLRSRFAVSESRRR